MDPKLWKVENYPDSLTEGRNLLAQAATDFLNKLIAGSVPETKSTASILDRTALESVGGIEDEEEERKLRQCNAWVVKHGLPEGELMYELTDPSTGDPLAVLDLAWPNGLQEGLSQPVALLLDEGPEVCDS